MRYRLALAAVVLQVLVLAYMAGEREWIIRNGRTLLLRTAPMDPNDPMRGDYARLDYDIGQVPKTLCTGGLAKLFAPNVIYQRGTDTLVYARLKLDETGVAELTSLSDQRPADGLFVRGRVESASVGMLRIRYGIEALFMQQGSAQKLEDMRRNEKPGVPLDMQVAVGPSGIAVLKGYQWEPLGITVTFERSPAPPAGGQSPRRPSPPQFITAVKVQLKNHGTDDVAIVAPRDGSSFRLVPDQRWSEPRYDWVGMKQTAPAPAADDVIMLKPGQSHTTRIDLTQSEWFVTDLKAAPEAQKPMALREVTETWAASFRIEYAPPAKASVTGLPHAELIRSGRLRSRAFNPTAGQD